MPQVHKLFEISRWNTLANKKLVDGSMADLAAQILLRKLAVVDDLKNRGFGTLFTKPVGFLQAVECNEILNAKLLFTQWTWVGALLDLFLPCSSFLFLDLAH